jgi:hypothetical protein
MYTVVKRFADSVRRRLGNPLSIRALARPPRQEETRSARSAVDSNQMLGNGLREPEPVSGRAPRNVRGVLSRRGYPEVAAKLSDSSAATAESARGIACRMLGFRWANSQQAAGRWRDTSVPRTRRVRVDGVPPVRALPSSTTHQRKLFISSTCSPNSPAGALNNQSTQPNHRGVIGV